MLVPPRLLEYACKRGMWALAAFLLPVAARGVEGVPGLLAACAAFSPERWSLLHLAVASGSRRMVEVHSLLCRSFPSLSQSFATEGCAAAVPL